MQSVKLWGTLPVWGTDLYNLSQESRLESQVLETRQELYLLGYLITKLGGEMQASKIL
jgi:hypothetical protein